MRKAMNKPNINMYGGSYSRRRFSNLASTSAQPTVVSGGTVASYTLEAYSANPEMGRVVTTVVSAVVAPTYQERAASPSSGGTVSGGNVTRMRLASGSVVDVTAKPNSGYRFAGWGSSTSASRQNNPVRVTMNGNKTLVAYFEPIVTNHTLHVNWDDNKGRVNASGSGLQNGEMTAASGTQITLEATPKDGYVFDRWNGVYLGGNVQNNNSRRITITMPPRDLTVAAIFAQSAETPGGGGGTPGGGTTDEPYTPGNDTPQTVEPGNTIINVSAPATTGLADRAVAFVKKWWWALAIAAFVYHESKKGGKS